MECRPAVDDDVPWLTDTFIVALRSAITAGTQAMRRIASQAGERPVHLAVLKANTAARHFYERLGCHKVSTSRHHDHFVWPTAAFATVS
jgi:RimJ/RimL family protein N-acetyltransferase